MGTSQVKENHCEALELKNAVYQVIRNGVYHALPEKDWCSRDRPAFKQSGANQNYMYYIDIGDGWRGWMIGSRLCQNLGGVAAAGNAMTPDEVPRGGWEEVFRGDWHYSQDMIAVCKHPLSTSAIVAVSVSGVVLIAVIVGIALCCYMKNKTKHNSTVRASENQSSNTRRRQRPQVATVSGQTDSRRIDSSQSTMIGPGHAIPSDFVYVAAPPPYNEDYKHIPPPSYADCAVLDTTCAQVAPPPPPMQDTNGTQPSNSEQGFSPESASAPPPYSPPSSQNDIPNNAHTNLAFEAGDTGDNSGRL